MRRDIENIISYNIGISAIISWIRLTIINIIIFIKCVSKFCPSWICYRLNKESNNFIWNITYGCINCRFPLVTISYSSECSNSIGNLKNSFVGWIGFFFYYFLLFRRSIICRRLLYNFFFSFFTFFFGTFYKEL